MPRIRCHYIDCVFIDDGYCGAAAVDIDPDMGCTTYSRSDEMEDDDWQDEEKFDGYDEIELDEDDDLWLDED